MQHPLLTHNTTVLTIQTAFFRSGFVTGNTMPESVYYRYSDFSCRALKKNQSSCMHTSITSDSKFVNICTHTRARARTRTHTMHWNAVCGKGILIVFRSHKNDQNLKSANGYVLYLHVSRYCSLNLCPYGLHGVHVQLNYSFSVSLKRYNM